MTADEITKAVAERLGIDLYDDSAVTDFQGRVNAVMGILSRAGCNGTDDQYIEAITVGVNDLLTMESSGGGFSAGFLFLVNQLRFGGNMDAGD